MGLAIAFVIWRTWRSLWQPHDRRPLQWAIALTLLSFFGIIVSLFPYVVPYKYTLYDIANDRKTLVFAGVGICIVLPVILLYLTLAYRVFRGKSPDSSTSTSNAPSLVSRRTSGRDADLHMS